MSSQVRLQSTISAFEEVRIPMPWGHIAGKWWGPRDKRPILTIHGWQDNCGSFDLLIPVLPNDLSFLAIDMPGHGLSSRIPPGMFYHGLNSIFIISQIKDYFGWEKISLMGHSFGGITSYIYGFFFPETVDFCICIDGLYPFDQADLERAVQTVEQFIKYDRLNLSTKEPPSYTLDAMASLLNEGTSGSVDLDKCKYILERNIKPSRKHEGKFYFDRDPRLKCGNLYTWSEEELVHAAGMITFPIFLSKTEFCPFFVNEELFKKTSDIIKKTSKDFDYHVVPGEHHGHLNTPEIFKDIIPNFIRKHDVEGRSTGGLKEEMRVANFTRVLKSNL